MEKEKVLDITSALKENRCAICGTPDGKDIKVVDEVYQVHITMRNFIPICNICLPHYPESCIEQDLDFTHLVWFILERRLHQQTVYTKVCKYGCGTPIITARKEKEFCSNNCRAKYWQKQAKIKLSYNNLI